MDNRRPADAVGEDDPRRYAEAAALAPLDAGEDEPDDEPDEDDPDDEEPDDDEEEDPLDEAVFSAEEDVDGDSDLDEESVDPFALPLPFPARESLR